MEDLSKEYSVHSLPKNKKNYFVIEGSIKTKSFKNPRLPKISTISEWYNQKDL